MRLYFSDAYPQDAARPARWVAFLGNLPHGRELSRLTVYFTSPDGVGLTCGADAYACYSADDQSIVTAGDDVEGGPTADDLLAHEYGHHVAANRSNAPWVAADWGTKRWASYENVCAREREGSAYPGSESDHYTLNPGEAFAETYRALADHLRSLPFTWGLADPTFEPDANALALVRRDVLDPWAPSTVTRQGSLPAIGRTKQLVVATPRDGTVVLRLATRPRASVTLTTRPATRFRASSNSYAGTICGEHRLTIRITSRTSVAAGRFTLHVLEP